MKKKTFRVRCWIDIDGEKFFGPGRAELLSHIETTGSIAKAAKAMGMSYKKAWDMVEEMNALGQKPYVVARKGGEKGGGAEVTATAKAVVAAYRKLDDKLQALVARNEALLKLI
ncbi:winged helix-turn-helix domain-containing protein [Chryseolinea lacunae]|uniref:LysR family transcriptional regulator n=1 Tax=Chryseolinea lacunae TaxID=2801331 RepID=A0ABS1KUN8_9BACT|nr:LysR family transcriptional regulator [Chryseolinea lacunae]MBL0743176.1 LysR family transcriptional regulator [Chryseolinea lacunae]